MDAFDQTKNEQPANPAEPIAAEANVPAELTAPIEEPEFEKDEDGNFIVDEPDDTPHGEEF